MRLADAGWETVAPTGPFWSFAPGDSPSSAAGDYDSWPRDHRSSRSPVLASSRHATISCATSPRTGSRRDARGRGSGDLRPRHEGPVRGQGEPALAVDRAAQGVHRLRGQARHPVALPPVRSALLYWDPLFGQWPRTNVMRHLLPRPLGLGESTGWRLWSSGRARSPRSPPWPEDQSRPTSRATGVTSIHSDCPRQRSKRRCCPPATSGARTSARTSWAARPRLWPASIGRGDRLVRLWRPVRPDVPPTLRGGARDRPSSDPVPGRRGDLHRARPSRRGTRSAAHLLEAPVTPDIRFSRARRERSRGGPL